ncbi:MAG: hypothetical protein M1816_003138 [Peltula sp. TS41687]|nr:MAG: hypothetical protein M1816_003138 [Peltula sp. TS41687]
MTVDLLRPPTKQTYAPATRPPSAYTPFDTFTLPSDRHYQQQYSDIYFLRLAKLKPFVEQNASEAWDGFQIAGNVVRKVERVLDVRQGELCWVAGTVYFDMPLKPNILDDISKDHWISVPPPREKYRSPDDGADQIMLEDESGRLRLIGTPVTSELLVTGCIIAVMGTENANGDFEVIDIRLPEMARQPQRWAGNDDDDDGSASPAGKKEGLKIRESGGKVAIVSGLGISGDEADDMTIDLLMEYLLGEATVAEEAKQITRLIIAGNSLSESAPLPTREDLLTKKTSKKYGYDSSAYNPAPTAHLDSLLAQLLPTIPITLIPGASDPANVSIPQQPIHTAMFPHSRAYTSPPSSTTTTTTATTTDSKREPGWFDPVTNPFEADLQGWRILGTAGQPIDDIFKYIEEEEHDDTRLEIMHQMLRWRCSAPTAPDTLWCYPFQSDEPFVINETPHVFFVGNQPSFSTTVVQGEAGGSGGQDGGDQQEQQQQQQQQQQQTVRLITIPRFKDTGEVVLVDLDDLAVELLKFDLFGLDAKTISHAGVNEAEQDGEAG